MLRKEENKIIINEEKQKVKAIFLMDESSVITKNDNYWYINIAKDRKVIPDPIDDRKFQE